MPIASCQGTQSAPGTGAAATTLSISMRVAGGLASLPAFLRAFSQRRHQEPPPRLFRCPQAARAARRCLSLLPASVGPLCLTVLQRLLSPSWFDLLSLNFSKWGTLSCFLILHGKFLLTLFSKEAHALPSKPNGCFGDLHLWSPADFKEESTSLPFPKPQTTATPRRCVPVLAGHKKCRGSSHGQLGWKFLSNLMVLIPSGHS